MLYNPYYNDWKLKRKDYIKYEQLVKMQKRGMRKYQKHQTSPTNQINSDCQPEADEFKKQKDDYLMKEIRTFDEVFKAIKKDQKEMKDKLEKG